MNRKNIYPMRRKKRKQRLSAHDKASLALLAAGVIIVLGFTSWGHISSKNSDNETSGRIAGSSADLFYVSVPENCTAQTVEYEGFEVSFNADRHLPNYAVWELTEQETKGTLSRNSKFFSDPDVRGCATLDDYRNSGFDRGHMAPAGDMKWSEKAMNDSHSLANMCPQDHAVNGGRWATLENKCREWARRDSALVIICGPILTDVMPQTIGQSKVPVPRRFFKVILAPYSNPPKAIGFIVPNYYTPDGLESMTYSVDAIEEITGLDFFSSLPDDIESKVESEANFRYWNRRTK